MTANIFIFAISQLLLVRFQFFLVCWIGKCKTLRNVLIIFWSKVNRLAAILKNGLKIQK